MKRTGITLHTVSELRALTTILPQLGDQVMISDLNHAIFKYLPVPGTDDGDNVIVQNDGSADRTWVRQGLSLIGTFDLPYTALPDNTSDVVEVAATGVKRTAPHVFTVVSGMPQSANGSAMISWTQASADDKVAIEIANNTGEALTAGDPLKINVFRIGG